MAQWQELVKRNLLQGYLSHLYEARFPRHIRHSLCLFIESQDWDSAAVDESKARTCFHALLLYVEEERKRSIQENMILQAPDFPGMQDYLLKHFKDKPQSLATILSHCLKEEKKVLASTSEPQPCVSPLENKRSELDDTVSELKRQMMELKKETKTLEVLCENLDYVQKTWLEKMQQHTGVLQSQALNEECAKHTNFVTKTKQVVLQQTVTMLNQAEHIVTVLVGVELPEWKRRQQMACIGCPADTCLDHLQKWFTTVAEVLLQIRQQVQKMQEQNKKLNSTDACCLPEEVDTYAQSLVTKLLTNALVVEKQPVMSSLPQRPLILKLGVRFTATVRFLINLPEIKDLLKVTPVFDKDVEEAVIVKGFRQFDFSRDNSKLLDVDSPSGGLMAEFAYMEIKRRTKRSCEGQVGVCEELHLVKFVTRFQHAGLECSIEASSLPVIVVSSSSQVSSAWASIMWCNMLSTSEPRNLSVYSSPPPLSWQQLSQVLSWQFLSAGQRGLDENQLFMLRDKVGVDPDGLVQWSNFSKNESAWVWIDGILDLIRKHLVDIWREGHIMGFVSRERTRVLLQEKPTGTFLLRFSESNKEGAITFSWVKHSNGEAHVHSVEPYTKKELMSTSLPDILYLYRLGSNLKNPLIYLYPDVPKDTAFGCYYNPDLMMPKKDLSGYVNRIPVHVSLFSTSPHSPPMKMDMDAEPDTTMETDLYLEELISDILTLPVPSDWCCEETDATQASKTVQM